jgi:hypothetical protein
MKRNKDSGLEKGAKQAREKKETTAHCDPKGISQVHFDQYTDERQNTKKRKSETPLSPITNDGYFSGFSFSPAWYKGSMQARIACI